MDNEKKRLVEGQLALAGTDAKDRERKERLETLRRITIDRELPPMTFLMRLFGVQCFPRGELVAITGKAKSGKTLAMSMLMACCARRSVLAFRRESEAPLRVLWVDTEQSEQSTQDILRNRIAALVCPPAEQAPYARTVDRDSDGTSDGELPFSTFPQHLYDVFNLRGESWQERLPMLELAMRDCQPDMVVLDGIRDLVNDINDGPMAQQVVEQLMALVAKTQCCLVCVIHQNKSGEDHNLRGWLGTELMNKAFEIYTCEKQMPRRLFTFRQENTRKYDIADKLCYSIDGRGLPQQVEGVIVDATEEKPRKKPKKQNIDIAELFRQAMNECRVMPYNDLCNTIMNLTDIKSPPQVSILINQAVAANVIIKGKDNSGHVVCSLIPY